MKAMIVALLMSLGFFGSAHAQSVNYFYCFATDPDSHTVLMSQTMRVGPVAERKNYGAEFARFLRDSGRVTTTVTGYCTMRPTAADIDHARLMLPSECSTCGGAEGYQNVTWPRETLSPQQHEMNAAIAAVTPPTPPAVKPPEKPEPVTPQFVLTVMANSETGALELGHNELAKDVAARAKAGHATGWKTLITSNNAGFGAAFCVEHKGKTEFFVTEGREFREEALREAVRPALAYADKVDSKVALCSKWRARFPGAAAEPEPDAYWFELLQGFIREQVATCKTGGKCRDERFLIGPRSASGVRG